MPALIYRLSIILTAAVLAVFPFCGAYSECQKLGEFCGNPASDTFPACCPFDTDSEDEQVALKCKNLDNGVGTCEIVEKSDKTDEEPNKDNNSDKNKDSGKEKDLVQSEE